MTSASSTGILLTLLIVGGDFLASDTGVGTFLGRMVGLLGLVLLDPCTRLELKLGESFDCELWFLPAFLALGGEIDFVRVTCALGGLRVSRMLSILGDFRTPVFLSTSASEDLLLLVSPGFFTEGGEVPLRGGKTGGGEMDTGDLCLGDEIVLVRFSRYEDGTQPSLLPSSTYHHPVGFLVMMVTSCPSLKLRPSPAFAALNSAMVM